MIQNMLYIPRASTPASRDVVTVGGTSASLIGPSAVLGQPGGVGMMGVWVNTFMPLTSLQNWLEPAPVFHTPYSQWQNVWNAQLHHLWLRQLREVSFDISIGLPQGPLLWLLLSHRLYIIVPAATHSGDTMGHKDQVRVPCMLHKYDQNVLPSRKPPTQTILNDVKVPLFSGFDIKLASLKVTKDHNNSLEHVQT